jgi:hypothetical protein
MRVDILRPQKRTNVRAWFAPGTVLAAVRRRWESWPIRYDALDLDLREEDVLADLRAGRS